VCLGHASSKARGRDTRRVGDVNEKVTLYVTVGLPGAGKTVRARQLEERHRALRLTTDEWTIPLFGADEWWTAEAVRRHDALEGRLVWLAVTALRLGTNVVLDFGVWSRDERSALKYLAAREGALCELVYLQISPEEQKKRLDARFSMARSSTFVMTDEHLAEFRQSFQEPDEVELRTTDPGPPPEGFSSWEEWTQARWPTALAD
jgi:predicted kinase